MLFDQIFFEHLFILFIIPTIVIVLIASFYWFLLRSRKDKVGIDVQVKKTIEEAKKTTDKSEPPDKPEPVGKSVEEALSATKQSFWGRIKEVFDGQTQLNEEQWEEIEEILYTSDLGPQTVNYLLKNLKEKLSGQYTIDDVKKILRIELIEIFRSVMGEDLSFSVDQFNTNQEGGPTILFIVGVNGSGKTTSIGKIAAQLAKQGKSVLVAAGDTFRAAAGEQLKVWTERAQVEIFNPETVKDPSAVVFEACQKGKSKGFDYVIVDTAGRLHTQSNLMEELRKMKRVSQKIIPSGPHEVLIVLDANSGQNALVQARQFQQAVEITGVVLTKMDGTAKGGVAVGVACDLKLPIKLIGVGEGIGDLRGFSASEFVLSII